MKLRVLSENPITIIEYKKIIDLVKSLKPDVTVLKNRILKLFPERFKDIYYKGKKAIVICLDKKEASSHRYETKFEQSEVKL